MDITPEISTQDEILYHYCSMEAFEKIISQKIFWASDARNLNDISELKILENLIDGVINRSETENCSDFFRQMRDSLFSVNSKVVQYVFCLSKARDSLDQWIKYADNGQGVAIGWRRSDLEQFINQNYCQNDHGIYSRIEDIRYIDSPINEEDKARILRSLISSIIPHCREKDMAEFTSADKYMLEVTYGFFCMISSCLKDKCFTSEQETRMIFSGVPSDASFSILTQQDQGLFFAPQTKYRVARKKLIPYLEIDWKGVPLYEIILPPEHIWKNKDAQAYVKHFMAMHEYQNVQVTRSMHTYVF